MLNILIKKVIPIVMMVGLIGIMTSFLFSMESGYLSTMEVNDITLYYIDLNKWISNINAAITSNPINMDDVLPQGSFVEVSGSALESNFWEAIINNLAYAFNWLYAPINVLLVLIRWIAYVARAALSIFGWPMTTNTDGSYTSILMQLLTSIMQYLKIPYISI